MNKFVKFVIIKQIRLIVYEKNGIMKKKFLLISLVIGFLFMTVFAGLSYAASYKKPSDYKIGLPYAMAVNSDKPSVVLVYADWCGFCKRFMPSFESLYKQYGTRYNFSMVNGDNNKAIESQLNVKGYPSLYIIDKKYKQQIFIDYNYYLDNSAMTARLNLYLKRRQEWANQR